jgi:hydrogenase maturation protease
LEKKILILGVGNYLMGDEGVGVHTINHLQKMGFPPGVNILDGGTGGFHLLEYLETHPKAILVDATMDNNPVGTIRLIKPKFADDFPNAMSSHDIGLKDMMNALQLLDKMPEIYLFVISIASIQQQGIELTQEIRQILPELTKKIRELTNELFVQA